MTDVAITLRDLPDRDRRRVMAAAALMTSDKDGEALAAVRATCRMLAPHGVGIADVVAAALAARPLDNPRREARPQRSTRRRPAAPDHMYMTTPHQRLAKMCILQNEHINDWERAFLDSILRERTLSPRQHQKLEAIAAKIDVNIRGRDDGDL